MLTPLLPMHTRLKYQSMMSPFTYGCVKGPEWKRELALISMAWAKVDANTISYSAASSSCEKEQEWQLTFGLLGAMAGAS